MTVRLIRTPSTTQTAGATMNSTPKTDVSMSDCAPTFRPPHAVIMWSDDNWSYVELPVTGDVPYVCKFALTEAGLSKALHVLRTARTKRLPATVSYQKPPPIGHIARITHPKLALAKPTTTPEQRAKATEVLRKLKLLGK